MNPLGDDMSFSITTWRWIFGTLTVLVLGAGVFVFEPEDSIIYSAALAGAGALFGVLVPLFACKIFDSQVGQWVLLAMTVSAVALLAIGSLNLNLPDVEQMVYIMMGAAMLSAFGGATASRLCAQQDDAPQCEEATPSPSKGP